MRPLVLGREDYSDFQRATAREWLVTNGLGGYACGTVGEANTRRYHGMLTAAFSPPGERTLLVAKVEVTVQYRGETFCLFANEYADGTIAPQGYVYLDRFCLEGGTPVWRYAIRDAVIEKRILMQPGHNVTYLTVRVLRASELLEFELVPLCTYRGYHHHGHGGWEPAVVAVPHGFEINAFPGAHPYRVTCHGAAFIRDPAWHWNFRHRVESERGLDDREDLFRPGRFTLTVAEAGHADLVINAAAETPATLSVVRDDYRMRRETLLQALPGDAPPWIRQLVLAADQFVAERHGGGTIIAGYPWFEDWGRDTMIALTGLTLVPRRYNVAAGILRSYATHVSQGMLPNRFPDGGQTPEYNTADAALWYFHALHQYMQRSGDGALVEELYPVLADIIDWHRRGTRYGIAVDAEDGLLAAGEAGTQLTWMDARAADRAVTPRVGKPVEINALWFNALRFMAQWSDQLGRTSHAVDYRQAARRVKHAFRRFWNQGRGCLYDVIDGLDGEIGAADRHRCDGRLRPNQLFAVALPHSPLDSGQQKAVVDVCARELVTPYGLRSLARGEPGYVARYEGGPMQRDAAYHQGTVWAWLIGPFVDAHYRVYRDAPKALTFLESFGTHVAEACMGSISEVFDGEPPYRPRGAFAQAWSVAEVLRAWADLRGKSLNSVSNDERRCP